MTLTVSAMTGLADFREEILHEQSPAEACCARALGDRLRRTLCAAAVTRGQFAKRNGLALELIVAVENGYGRPETAWRLVQLAQASLEHR